MGAQHFANLAWREIRVARPDAVTARCRAIVRGALASALLVGSACLASPDHDPVEALAQQRYGAQAVEAVQAWRRLIEQSRELPEAQQIERVNTFFNQRIAFQDDAVVWQQTDYWATPLELMGRGAGDCEDYAIAKYLTLRALGIADARLRIVYVRARQGTTSVAHMVLGFYPQPTDEPLILDNLMGRIQPASQRADLVPQFSFNAASLWIGNASASSADPTARLSRWRDLLERTRRDGLIP